MMNTNIGRVRAILTRTSPKSELLSPNLVKRVKIGIMFTCPGIANPIAKSPKRTLPERVTERAWHRLPSSQTKS